MASKKVDQKAPQTVSIKYLAGLIIPVIVALIIAVIRTRLEDRTLQEELPGYRDYTRRVRYRLFPGIY